MEAILLAGSFIALFSFFALIVYRSRKEKQHFSQALSAIQNSNFQEARELLEGLSKSKSFFPENKLCLAYVCAILDDKKACLMTLKDFKRKSKNSYNSSELELLIDFLEGKSPAATDLGLYTKCSEDYYQASEKSLIEEECDNEDHFTNELNQSLDASVLCALTECMLALQPRSSQTKLAQAISLEDPLYPWLKVIRNVRA